MSSNRDGTEPGKTFADGYGEASGFYPQKSARRAAAANVVEAGASLIQQTARGLTPSTDVTVRTKVIANAGTSAGAGLVPGAGMATSRRFKARRGGVWLK